MLRDRHARRRLIAFVVLVGLSLVMLAVSGSGPVRELRNGVKFAIAPVQDTLSDGTRSMTSVLGAITEVDTLRRENEELSQAVSRLEEQLASLEALREENQKLAKQLRTKKDLEPETSTVAATVTAHNASQFERLVTIDRGSESGILQGDPMLGSGGALAGRVTEVGRGWAEVMLISDSRFLVAGQDNRTGATGNVVGRLAAPLAMTEIPRDDKISERDLIVTLGARIGKGFRPAYPPGLPIGRVVDVIDRADNVVKTALVVPLADLEHLEHVLVVVEGRESRRAAGEGEAATEQ